MSKAANQRSTSGTANTNAMRRELLAWYARHKRELPWRRDRDPYRVWVSEIMLQQTRVAAVLEHYHAFLQAFPTLQHLAGAPEEQVLARWSGLGYYRRARTLHQAARKVAGEMGGAIPRDEQALRMLPGVGRYTAAAIASIAFGEPVAVLDGNVERVLGRLDGKKRSSTAAWKRAQELLDPGQPGDWNQAMMELGATVCTPRNPQCPACPLHIWCRAPGADTSRQRPAHRKVQSVRNLIARGECIFLVQRPADAAKMAGMWELPECSAPSPQPAKDWLVGDPSPQPAEDVLVGPAAESKPRRGELCGAPGEPAVGLLGLVVRHSITDTDYTVRVLRLGLRSLGPKQKLAGRWVRRQEAFELPLTGLTRKILRRVPGPDGLR